METYSPENRKSLWLDVFMNRSGNRYKTVNKIAQSIVMRSQSLKSEDMSVVVNWLIANEELSHLSENKDRTSEVLQAMVEEYSTTMQQSA